MPYMERRVVAGQTIEVERYYTIRTGAPEGARAKREKPTPERVKKNNARKREDNLRQLMNANFTDEDFMSCTLTYRKGEEPESIRQVREDAADFARRFRKCAREFGLEPKYIYCIGAGPHRRHIHITVSKLPDIVILTGCWTHGHVNITPLYSKGQYRDLAHYYLVNAEDTLKQEEELGEKPGRRFICSHNMTKPKVTKKLITAKEFRAEPIKRSEKSKYYIEKDSVWYGISEYTGLPFLRYTLMKLEEKHGRNKTVHLDRRVALPGRQSRHTIRARIPERGQGDRDSLGSLHRGSESAGSDPRGTDRSHDEDTRRQRDEVDARLS